MLGLKRPKFKSKKDAYETFFSYFMAPHAILAFGIMMGVRSCNAGLASYDQAKHYIYFVAAVSVVALFYCWYKAFWAVASIMKDDYGNTPETVVCLDCETPFFFDKVNKLSCPKCGGPLEDLEGFYERHPELRNSDQLQENSVQQKNRADSE